MSIRAGRRGQSVAAALSFCFSRSAKCASNTTSTLASVAVPTVSPPAKELDITLFAVYHHNHPFGNNVGRSTVLGHDPINSHARNLLPPHRRTAAVSQG